MKSQSNFRRNSPLFYGSLYIAFIVLFSMIFWVLPENYFKCDSKLDFLTSLYFSTITITTVGYGDISPAHWAARILVIVEAISGITFIGLFLNEVAQSNAKKASLAEKERAEIELHIQDLKKLLRYDNLVQQSIKLYLEYTYSVTTPLADRTNGLKINPNFRYNDLHDLYYSAMVPNGGLLEPAITGYYKHLNSLLSDIKNLMLSVELQKVPNLEKQCVDFLNMNNRLDYSGFILELYNTMLGERKAWQVHSEWLKNYNGDEPEFKGSNTMNSFTGLYYQIKYNLAFINEYNSTIDIARKNLATLQEEGQSIR